MHPYDLDEHQLRELVENALAAGALVVGLRGGEPNELVEQPVRTIRYAAPEPHEARQRLQQRIERSNIAAEEPANQMSFGRTFTAGSQHERQGVVVLGSAKDVHDRFGAHARRAGQRMRIAMRHYRDVAFLKLDRFEGAAIDNGDPARAAGNDMIFDRMLRAGRDLVGDPRRGGASATQGDLALTSKNTAPVRRTAESTSDRTSVSSVHISIGRDFFPDTDVPSTWNGVCGNVPDAGANPPDDRA